MVNKKGNGAVVVMVLIVLAILAWGVIGGQEAQKVGITCDMGIGDSLCWQWHKNLIGQAGEALNNLFGDNRYDK
jgi:hypothetical protein